MFLRRMFLAGVALTVLLAPPAPFLLPGVHAQECETLYTPITCSDCPQPAWICWSTGPMSYMVFGTPVETWCNFVSGWCSAFACVTTDSITTARDCNGNISAGQLTICCEPY
jgi:hypothetical protein